MIGRSAISCRWCCCNRWGRLHIGTDYCVGVGQCRSHAVNGVFAAYIQVMRLGGAEIGISLMATWLRVREQTHSNFIGQHIVNGSVDVNQTLAKMSGYFSNHDSSVAPARALGLLSSIVQREANTLAYIDGFWLTVWFAIAALYVLSALIGPSPQGPLSPRSSRSQ